MINNTVLETITRLAQVPGVIDRLDDERRVKLAKILTKRASTLESFSVLQETVVDRQTELIKHLTEKIGVLEELVGIYERQTIEMLLDDPDPVVPNTDVYVDLLKRCWESSTEVEGVIDTEDNMKLDVDLLSDIEDLFN